MGLSEPDALAVNVEFFKDLKGFGLVVAIGNNLDASAVTEDVVDQSKLLIFMWIHLSGDR